MRQAGRSLPEYRDVRGSGSILDAIKQPDLAAEITLQPVRRYGVDAAVLYSDIVVPAHAVGFGIDVAPGTGPVAAGAVARGGRRSPGCVRSSPTTCRTSPRRSPLVAAELGADVPVLAFAGAPFTVASYLIEGAPSRTYEHTKALIHTDEALWHDVMDRLAGDGRGVHRRPARRRRPGVPAVRLVGGDAVAGRLRALRAAALAPGVRRAGGAPPRRARHPLRHRVRPPARGDVGGRAPGDGARLAHADQRRRAIASAPGSPCRATSIRRSCSPARRLALAGARRVLADNGGHPGHVFNLGHGVHPTTDPGVLAAIVELVHTDTATTGAAATEPVATGPAGDDRRRADGVRHAAGPRGDRAVLHRHPARPAADARAARRPDPAVRRDRGHLAARRADRRPSADVLQARPRRAPARARTASGSG